MEIKTTAGQWDGGLLLICSLRRQTLTNRESDLRFWQPLCGRQWPSNRSPLPGGGGGQSRAISLLPLSSPAPFSVVRGKQTQGVGVWEENDEMLKKRERTRERERGENWKGRFGRLREAPRFANEALFSVELCVRERVCPCTPWTAAWKMWLKKKKGKNYWTPVAIFSRFSSKDRTVSVCLKFKFWGKQSIEQQDFCRAHIHTLYLRYLSVCHMYVIIV